MDQLRKPDLKLVDPLNGGEGTVFDKPAPTAPPQAPVREIPTHLKKIVQFFSEIIADEGLLLDLCVDRAVGIVEYNYKKRAFGSDFFQGEQPTPIHFIMTAGPLATELYKQVLASIAGRADEYAAILKEAQDEASRKSGTPPLIQIP